MIALGCAHPAKFPDAVERATGIRPGLPPPLGDLFDKTLPGYGERRFAMVVRASAEPGTGKLSWQLTPDGPSAGAAITITP